MRPEAHQPLKSSSISMFLSITNKHIIKLCHALEGGHRPSVVGLQSTCKLFKSCPNGSRWLHNRYFGEINSFKSCNLAKISPWLGHDAKVDFFYFCSMV